VAVHGGAEGGDPDVFHDVFGHVPILTDPTFADDMQAYGRGGARAAGLGQLHSLARLYWYTVEFGLMAAPEGPRIHGAGIVSSRAETLWSLEDPRPRRVPFELELVMRTAYRIDDLQPLYLVIQSLQTLLDVTQQDFAPVYARLKGQQDLALN
jgi:phenylalanine-4-hydroxylase